MNDEQRQAKRPRRTNNNNADDNVNNNKDDDDLAAMMLLGDEDDDFMTAKARQVAEAERRRQERRERLRKIAAQEEQAPVTNGKGSSRSNKKTTTATTPTTNTKSKAKEAVRKNAPTPKQQQNDNYKDEAATENNAESGNESFDMFTSSPPPPPKKSTSQKANKNHNTTNGGQGQHQQDWDDAEGYYNAVIGETIQVFLENHDPSRQQQSSTLASAAAAPSSSLSFRVDGVIGKGVFSTVLKVTTTSNTTSAAIPPTVAIKMIRHNETMAKAAANEIRFLHQLRNARGIIPLLLPIASSSNNNNTSNANNSPLTTLEHRGHVLLVFPFVEYNLRDVLQKFGKGVGLSLSAVRSYFGQLLSALSHLQKLQIIHADIKPDNILVQGGDDNFLQVYLADFGSAFNATAPENQPTPYLVSRFYRAPEIILGLTPTISIDLWSLAVSIAELFLGNVVFRGKSNNDMLHVFMQHLGVFSNRMVRQHLVQLTKLPTLARQFDKSPDGANFCFLQHTVDTVTGNPIHERLPMVSSAASKKSSATTSSSGRKFPLATPLASKILRAKSASDARSEVQQFADLLQKCLALDPTRRISLKDALRHDFFQPAKAAAAATKI